MTWIDKIPDEHYRNKVYRILAICTPCSCYTSEEKGIYRHLEWWYNTISYKDLPSLLDVCGTCGSTCSERCPVALELTMIINS